LAKVRNNVGRYAVTHFIPNLLSSIPASKSKYKQMADLINIMHY